MSWKGKFTVPQLSVTGPLKNNESERMTRKQIVFTYYTISQDL
jgi:hypothetical protein